MNASHASHARSSEEADMRLLRFRCGIESLPANAPAVLGAMALGRPLRFFAVETWSLHSVNCAAALRRPSSFLQSSRAKGGM